MSIPCVPWLWRASVSSDRSTSGRSWSYQRGRIPSTLIREARKTTRNDHYSPATYDNNFDLASGVLC